MNFNGAEYIDVKSQRVVNSTYSNNTSKGLLVVVGYYMPYNNPVTTFKVGNVSVAAANSDGGHTRGTFTLLIPPNTTYGLFKTNTPNVIDSWYEMYTIDDMTEFEVFDLTKQRAWDTTYQNDTGDGIWISISMVTKSPAIATLQVDDVIVGRSSSSTSHTNNHAIMTLVPAGSTYRLNKPTGTVSFNVWSEVRRVR